MPVLNFQSQDYTVNVTLKNGVNEISLGTAAILELKIRENIFQWFTSGYIVIDNLHLNLFRYSSESSNSSTQKQLDQEFPTEKKYYKIRGDGRDTIHILIKPEKDPKEVFKQMPIQESNWILELEAIIYDIQEPQDESNEKKTITLFFHDKTYQMMMEKNVEFSTATKGLTLSGKTPFDANNNDRSLRTGDAIANLLLTNGFEKHCKLIDPDNSNEFWNMGDPKNTVFYTSPANAKFSQDLQYLLDIHCGDEGTGFDPCIFKLERNQEPGQARQFTLKPLQDYFKKAGNNVDDAREYQLEIFTLDVMSDTEDTGAGKIIRIPLAPNEQLKQNFYAFDFSKITSYQFFDFSPLDATKDITNYLLVNYNLTNRQFNIQKDTIESAESHIKEKYLVEVMSPSQTLFLPKNNYMTQGYNTNVRYTLNFTESARRSEGRNKIILATLFKNMAISFTTIGATIRQPGRFISIMQGKLQNQQDYDNRLEGQYFLTEVEHCFYPNELKYENNIVGVKMHLFNPEEHPIPYEDDVIVMQ